MIIQRKKTRQIHIGSVAVGGDAFDLGTVNDQHRHA